MTNYIEYHRFDSILLACGVAVPVVYFGVQLAAAPFCPGYSFAAYDASTLGSSDSTFPALFNVAMIIVGLLMLLASFGIFRGLRRLGVRRAFVWPILLAMVCGGLASVNGGVFPLPDERHTNGVLAQIGVVMFLLPILMILALRSVCSGGVRAFLWINFAVLLGLVPIVSGLIQRVSVMGGIELTLYQEFLNNSHGVLQRVAAAVVFLPVGVVCWTSIRARGRQEL